MIALIKNVIYCSHILVLKVHLNKSYSCINFTRTYHSAISTIITSQLFCSLQFL